jgi:DNA-binding MarR family transcriptional regulator
MAKMLKTYVNNDEGDRSYRLLYLYVRLQTLYTDPEFELKKYGISPEQSGALVCIHSLRNTATPAELSRWLFREPNSITILLNRMQKLGLIKKTADKQRKNIIRLSLTEKGYEAYKHAVEFQVFFPIIDVLPERKRKQLWLLLQTIRDRVFEELRLDVRNYSGWLDNAILIEPDSTSINRKKRPHK